MTHYAPAEKIRDEYTDESLKAERVYKADAAAALLRVPAGYRQPVEVETSRWSTVTEWRDGMAMSRFVRDHHECRLEVIAEVLAQLGLKTYGGTE